MTAEDGLKHGVSLSSRPSTYVSLENLLEMKNSQVQLQKNWISGILLNLNAKCCPWYQKQLCSSPPAERTQCIGFPTVGMDGLVLAPSFFPTLYTLLGAACHLCEALRRDHGRPTSQDNHKCKV